MKVAKINHKARFEFEHLDLGSVFFSGDHYYVKSAQPRGPNPKDERIFGVNLTTGVAEDFEGQLVQPVDAWLTVDNGS